MSHMTASPTVDLESSGGIGASAVPWFLNRCSISRSLFYLTQNEIETRVLTSEPLAAELEILLHGE
jgi:hypothetical protein